MILPLNTRRITLNGLAIQVRSAGLSTSLKLQMGWSTHFRYTCQPSICGASYNLIDDLITIMCLHFMKSKFYIIALLVMLIRSPILHGGLGYRRWLHEEWKRRLSLNDINLVKGKWSAWIIDVLSNTKTMPTFTSLIPYQELVSRWNWSARCNPPRPWAPRIMISLF